MIEHTILFSAPMIRAILDGRKTMTRRIVQLPSVITEPNDADAISIGWMDKHESGAGFYGWMTEYPEEGSLPIRCPHGKPGDTLRVRETFSGPRCMGPVDGSAAIPPSRWPPGISIWYWADGNPEQGDWTRPKPSIHMPRWASRITLRVTDVRVERLQRITEDDAAAEGCSAIVEPDGSVTCGRRKSEFRDLWDSLNAKRGVGWDTNPWVWVISFERVEPKP